MVINGLRIEREQVGELLENLLDGRRTRNASVIFLFSPPMLFAWMGALMIFLKLMRGRSLGPALALAASVALAGCASEDVDDLTGSHMQPLPVGADNKPAPPIEAGDVAIAGQLFSHDVRALPQIASLTTPALVRFDGVTSLVMDKNHQLVPIDTAPYTTLLRDRLLLGDREKLRFIERQLPLLTAAPTGRHHHETAAPVQNSNADYEVRAELRGRSDASSFRIQIEFVDLGTGAVLVNGIYRIRPESSDSGNMGSMGALPPSEEPPPQEQGQTPLPNSANTPYGNNGWATPVPGINDSSTPAGQYNPPPPPQ